ncbi:hypothetical protein QNA08_09580 [Chelatococcus sp. SYSU_G07232]|uniref:Uncharacterized protein n=1 Tax=Chelatococcus albus TaxID=3047466 RepID=A0ABT7AI72_9HYPH|nr:hypothetical protein [Chelatococcus sp. SYSU_G07232]MDJ1158484.1 hypothetical protein [Chelatococcus sp. SYSU_G07232]
MPKLVPLLAAVTAASVLAGCVSTVENRENMLAAAGFKVKVADTPDKVAALTALPPHKFAQRSQDGRITYLYADPTICKCLYYGDETAYQTYQQMAFQQRLADQRQMTAMMLRDASWNYGVWGPFWW